MSDEELREVRELALRGNIDFSFSGHDLVIKHMLSLIAEIDRLRALLAEHHLQEATVP